MKKRSLIILILMILLMFSAIGNGDNCQDVLEQKEKGSVNWSRGVIQVKGIGLPPKNISGDSNARSMALKNAKLDAFYKILGIVKALPIDGDSVVGDYENKDNAVMSKISNMARNGKVVKKEYLTDGTVKIKMEMSLRGGFAQLVLPKEIKPLDSITSVTMNKTSSTEFTGLVVDARGLGVRPVMVPKILDENKQEVYGSAFVSREYAVQQGMCGYGRNLEEILKNPRVADHPLVVKGLKALRPGFSEIVISNADASKLRSSSESLSFLKKCRVIIVLD